MGPSGISFGSDFAAGTDSVTGLDSGMMSIAGNGWVSRSVVGSCSLSAVGMVAGSVSGVMMDGTWGWTLAAGYLAYSKKRSVDPEGEADVLMKLSRNFPLASPAGSRRPV